MLGALDDVLMMHQPHPHQPWRLDRCNPFIHSFMQQFMWQVDISSVAHFVMDCLDVLDDTHLISPRRLEQM